MRSVGAVEREFERLKHEWGRLLLRVRQLAHLRLRVDLTILTTLADTAVRARAGPLRRVVT